jgi:hypothetical protein
VHDLVARAFSRTAQLPVIYCSAQAFAATDPLTAFCVSRLLVEEQSLMRVRAEQESLVAKLADASSYGSS